ncbi:branched-chain amino acid ABC transporter permease [Pelagibius litoralis]|uniref:Branched-chain amino acid ABC transporter permease n=1 Tax=Pelagibius litoralis TaxID=374515 RepID=A0A967CAX0_9PROT|nr:branched-chain amino acid ABC transporter permease [Pelagibius litoralis]NIA67739.1 branched-chain amino acid ABC transporter permease [Pelagibius litoralis]
MDQALLLLLDATNYVLVIVLVAMGLVIVFGLMRVINMAHGELFLLGAYTLVVLQQAGLPYWLGLLAATVFVGMVGLLMEELVIRHIYHRFLDTILATWGLSIAIKQAVVLVFGPGAQSTAAPITAQVEIFGASYPAYRLFIMAVALLVVAATFYLFFRTRFGLAARAVIANRSMAACLGIPTRAFDRMTFAYGAALAGLAGAVMAPIMSVDPQMGLGFLIPAFLAILVGGAGHLAGPVLGAGLIGATDSVTAGLWSPVMAQVVVFAMAVIAIRIFPSGLLGRGGSR